MKRKMKYAALIVFCGISILALQIMMVQFFPEHRGTDDKSVEMILKIAPDYKPRVSSIWEPQDDFAEKLIFFIQAVLGVGVIVFYLLKQSTKAKQG